MLSFQSIRLLNVKNFDIVSVKSRYISGRTAVSRLAERWGNPNDKMQNNFQH